MKYFIYGPPGSGKTTLGRQLATALHLPFIDLDEEISQREGMSIPDIFAQSGEAGFREREKATLLHCLEGKTEAIIALGGGTLLNPENRTYVEKAGQILCITAPLEILQARIAGTGASSRPLLAPGIPTRKVNDPQSVHIKLEKLLAQRAGHYRSFHTSLDISQGSIQQLVHLSQVKLGIFWVAGMGAGYSVRIFPGSLSHLGEMLNLRGFHGKVVLVSDQRVSQVYAPKVTSSLQEYGYQPASLILRPGERYKNPQAVSRLWRGFVELELERASLVIALGGGVTGDIAGFAAATFLRGIPWAVLPTTLLAMVDASLGGKTGVDLPQGKNLVGAFHPPQWVLADPLTLETLPLVEWRSGFAEVVKTAVVGDAELFELCSQTRLHNKRDAIPVEAWTDTIKRSMAVKIQVIESDPYEQGKRASLNFGHTIGHALELLSHYRMRHGFAVSAGMVTEARIAERIGLAEPGLGERLSQVLRRARLPVRLPPGINLAALAEATRVDKKRHQQRVKFALPIRLGEVVAGVEVEDLEKILFNL